MTVPGPLKKGWVVWAEGYNSGWRAEQDGQSRRILPANGMFMAVEIEDGGELHLSFIPVGLREGAVVTVLTLGSLLIFAFLGFGASVSKRQG